MLPLFFYYICITIYMKAIKIDSEKRTISLVDVANYRNICTEINHSCERFICPIVFETLDVMYADYYAGINCNSCGFILDGWVHPILGNAIIVGTDFDGDLTDIALSIKDIEEQISFVSKHTIKNWLYSPMNIENTFFSKN